jgi:hypothetical protein
LEKPVEQAKWDMVQAALEFLQHGHYRRKVWDGRTGEALRNPATQLFGIIPQANSQLIKSESTLTFLGHLALAMIRSLAMSGFDKTD